MDQKDFSDLPAEYQNLLSLAKEKFGLEIIPLQQLKGGRTGAILFLASVSSHEASRIEHLVIKFDQVNEKVTQTEVDKHRSALAQAPGNFAKQHMANLVYELEDNGAIALFYNVAGQSLQRFLTLASLENQDKLEVLFKATNEYILQEWNTASTFKQAVHPQKLLENWLGYRLKSGGSIGVFLEDTFHINPGTEGFVIQGNVYPNPLSYALNLDLWNGARPIDVLIGFQHGDLNIGNILAMYAGDSLDLAGYFLIDFALYKAEMPLLYDQCYLELSFLIRELERTSLQKWTDLIAAFSSHDIPNPKEIPVELAGACTVINSARKSFESWIQAAHPSLSDDLWGQFWLAAVAVGLNFCNKKSLSTEERLAGLIYSASHFKRYCTSFGIPLPTEVRLLYDGKKSPVIVADKRTAQVTAAHKVKLPEQPTPFIGRQAVLLAVKDLLMKESLHLVTLTGPGGTGKTRLALQAASEVSNRYDGGVFFVDLAPIRDPESVFTMIIRSIGLRESGDKSPIDLLTGEIQDQKILLILDNFEQVTAAAPKVADLLRECPQLMVLITSRESLHVRGEQVLPVPPLGFPKENFRDLPMEQLVQMEAVQFFVESARAVKPEFILSDENAPSVVEICSRLDGLPLAIELATARLVLFSPYELLERVGNRLKLLRGGARDLPERQQTLRDTLNWSYDLLTPGERHLFALLSIFSGSTVEAVEKVAGMTNLPGETGVDILDELSSLVEKNLVRKSEKENGGSRLMMLDTIREYALERLEADPEFSQEARHAHATYYADFTHHEWERLGTADRDLVLGKLESDIENIRMSWRFWLAECDLTQLRKLTDGLWLFYDVRGWYQATVELSKDLLNVLSSTETSSESSPELINEKIVLHTNLARALLAVKGYTPEVEKAYTSALELSHAAGDVTQLFPVLRGLYSFYTMRGESDKGVLIGKQILDLAEQKDDDYLRITGYFVLGSSTAFTGDISTGLDYLDKGISYINPTEQSVRRYQIGNHPGVSCLTASSILLWGLGYPDRATQRADASVDLAKKLKHPYSLAYALFHNGYLRFWMRQVERSLEFAESVIDVADKHGFQIWTAVGDCLQGAGLVSTGKPDEGLSQIQQGMDMYQGLNSPPIFWPLLRGLQAYACGQAGKPGLGLTFISEPRTVPSQGFGRILAAELYQIAGNLSLMQNPDRPLEAEQWFQRALETAQEQKATMLELRAALCLARLWQNTDKAVLYTKILGDAYNKITEGFSLLDVQEAHEYLSKIKHE